MYLKRMCEHGRPLRAFKEEVLIDKPTKQGDKDAFKERSQMIRSTDEASNDRGGKGSRR